MSINTHHCYLQSADREDPNSDPANCRITLAKSLMPKCISLSYAFIPATFYNITERNNKFAIDATTYTVPAGCYTLADVMQAIADLLTAFHVTVSYDDVIGRMIISTTDPFININFSVANSIGTTLGFKNISYSDAASYTSSFVPKLYSNSIFISINGINSGCITSQKANVQNSTFIVPANVNKGEVIQFYKHSQFNLTPRVNDTINFFDIRFYDEFGFQLINLADWSLMLEMMN